MFHGLFTQHRSVFNMVRSAFFFLFFIFFVFGVNNTSSCRLPSVLLNEIQNYHYFVRHIIHEATQGHYSGVFYNDLAKFIDRFGNRLAGTKNLEESIEYIAKKATLMGLKVQKEPVKIPVWVRGKESAEIIFPQKRELTLLGLGFSPGTPSSGIKAEVIVVSNFTELEARAKEVEGKIVLFNPEYVNYGATVKYRTEGPAKAANLKAVAALVRSVTTFSISSPHTGVTDFKGEKIPAACITLEDADMIARMAKRGQKVVVSLNMEAQMLTDQVSHNLIIDLEGASKPEEYVTISGHIDSWDVGEGALDDGGGAFLALHTLFLLKTFNVKPSKRTIRAILWTAEEQGLLGAFSFLERHKDELKNWTVAIESDSGLFKPYGFNINGTDDAFCIVQEILKAGFHNINATSVNKSPSVGSDISIFQPFGVPLMDPLFGHNNYIWFHHTHGDSMRTLDSADLDQNLVLIAGMSYILADLSIPLPRKWQSIWKAMPYK